MKDIVWSNTLSVEVDEIDEDHHRLVDLFNMLAHSVSNGDKPDYIDALLEELISCTAWHFRHEERLMVRYDYEDLQEHKAEHQELIESARELQGKCQQEGVQISSDDIEFLETWLTSHIFTTDMKLGSYLSQAM